MKNIRCILLLSCVAMIGSVAMNGQSQVSRRALVTDQTTGRSVAFQAGRAAANMIVTLPSALPTVNQILVVPTESEYNVTTQWADPAGAGAVTSFVVKAADQDNNTTTYADVTDLVVPVVANRLYEFNAFVRGLYTGGAANIRIQFTVPAGTVMSYYIIVNDGAANDRGNFTEASDATLPTINVSREYELRGTILVGGTAGNVRMRFNSSSAGNNVRIQANSYMRATSLP